MRLESPIKNIMTVRHRIARSLLIVLLYAPGSAFGFVGIAGSSRAVPAGRITSYSSSTSSSRDGRTNGNDDEGTSNGGGYSVSRPYNIPSSQTSAMDRRRSLELCGGMALSLLLLSPSDACANVDLDDDAGSSGKRKRILITGSNSGIGLDAAQRMVVRGYEVVLACVSSSFDVME
jgi:hypothetical protein